MTQAPNGHRFAGESLMAERTTGLAIGVLWYDEHEGEADVTLIRSMFDTLPFIEKISLLTTVLDVVSVEFRDILDANLSDPSAVARRMAPNEMVDTMAAVSAMQSALLKSGLVDEVMKDVAATGISITRVTGTDFYAAPEPPVTGMKRTDTSPTLYVAPEPPVTREGE